MTRAGTGAGAGPGKDENGTAVIVCTRRSCSAGDNTPPAVWFAYSADRKGEHPQGHLRQFTGTLQADGYAGFEKIYETGRIQEAACWAHVRRKFYDLQAAHKSPVAAEALERISALKDIDKQIQGLTPEERREIRNTRFTAAGISETMAGSNVSVIRRPS